MELKVIRRDDDETRQLTEIGKQKEGPEKTLMSIRKLEGDNKDVLQHGKI